MEAVRDQLGWSPPCRPRGISWVGRLRLSSLWLLARQTVHSPYVKAKKTLTLGGP